MSIHGQSTRTAHRGARPPVSTALGERERLIDAVQNHLLAGDGEFRQFGANSSRNGAGGLLDYLFAFENEPHQPDEIFGRLRWGGQFIYISRSRATVAALPGLFKARGFQVLHGPGYVRQGPFSLLVPFLAGKVYYFVARKVYLIPPREVSDRFTYHVQLDDHLPAGVRKPMGTHYVVRKEVPSLERVAARLRQRFPEVSEAELLMRARKFTNKIFPIFLTREAAILQILQRDLSPQYAARVPRVLHIESDERGYVQRLWMTWLRNGGEPLTQLQFAQQAAELLGALHEQARVIHLDLRLDNVVITPEGVGFVDFGSSVRVGEDLAASALLSTLFDELMRTSQIQRMLSQMTKSGAVTSSVIANGYQRVDQAVDFFYLALQINQPHTNPDLADLVRYDPSSDEAAALEQLTGEILKPRDPLCPPYRCAADIARGLQRVEESLVRKRARNVEKLAR